MQPQTVRVSAPAAGKRRGGPTALLHGAGVGTARYCGIEPIRPPAHAWPRPCFDGEAMSTHLPSVTALESNDDDRIAAELRLARLRSQLAVVRTVADHVEQFSGAADADGLGQQLVEEIARLAARVLEAASGLTAASHAMMNPHVRHC
jgi:hypothetical protein